MFLKINLFYLFYFWLRWVFVAVHGLFSSYGERGLLFVTVPGLLIVVVSLVAEHGALDTRPSVVVAHGLNCSVACGIFPDQGSNPCPLHWQTDS